MMAQKKKESGSIGVGSDGLSPLGMSPAWALIH